jgi:hypothetical protein
MSMPAMPVAWFAPGFLGRGLGGAFGEGGSLTLLGSLRLIELVLKALDFLSELLILPLEFLEIGAKLL